MARITVKADGILREFNNVRDVAAFVGCRCLNCAVPLSKSGGLFCRDCYRGLHLDDKRLMIETMRGKILGAVDE